jgi:hypothetical protein
MTQCKKDLDFEAYYTKASKHALKILNEDYNYSQYFESSKEVWAVYQEGKTYISAAYVIVNRTVDAEGYYATYQG